MSDIIVSQSLLINACKTIDIGKIDSGYLFDLGNFVETIILNDKLVTIGLPGELHAADSSMQKMSSTIAGYINSPTRKMLINHGILDIIPDEVSELAKSTHSLASALDLNLDAHQNAFYAQGGNERLSFLPPYDFAGLLMHRDDEDVLSPNELTNAFSSLGKKEYRTYVEDTLKGWMAHIEISIWKWALEYRTLNYILMSQKLQLPFSADLLRSSLVQNHSKKINESMLSKAYDQISKSLEGSIKDLNELHAPFTVPIPPLLSLVLSQANNHNNLIEVILDFRKEFTSLRESFTRYDQGIRSATTLKEAKKYQSVFKNICSELNSKYSKPDSRGFVEALEYSESIVKAIADISKLSAYDSSLLTLPISWLRRWWIRRNAHQLFQLQNKMEQIPDIKKNVERIFHYTFQENPWGP